jgi:hypothetical protein
VSDPTADTPLPVAYGQTENGQLEARGEIASGIKAIRPRLLYRGGSILYPDGSVPHTGYSTLEGGGEKVQALLSRQTRL